MPLLAKSPDSRFEASELTLEAHSLRVAEACRLLVSALGEDLAVFFGFGEAAVRDLEKLAATAALLHDIGKCGASFQSTVKEGDRRRHAFRHEILSVALIVGDTPMAHWLRRFMAADQVALVAVAIAGHHLRAGRDMAQPRAQIVEEILHLDSPSVRAVCTELGRLGAPEPPPLAPESWRPRQISQQILGAYQCECQSALRGSDDEMRSLVPVLKALLIAADTVASGYADVETSLASWLSTSLSCRLTRDDLAPLIEERLAGGSPYGFQQRVAESRDRVTLVTAGCGNGKTLAAYMWALRHAVGHSLVFCYPTTGTSSAGFEDYLLAQSGLERALIHGRASVDIERLLRSPDVEEDLEMWAPDVLDRWGKKVVACTVDSALGLLAHWRSAMATLPLWARSAFVFDEIHSYDRQLFGALLVFLAKTRAPVLLMTASLSAARRRALEEAVEQPLVAIEGEMHIECSARYVIGHATEEQALVAAVESVREGRRVLWVANQVERARQAWRNLSKTIAGSAVRLYHSRFRYQDRVARQAEVLDAFRSQEGSVVVATQVCEMSLDISADLLITELAPLPALVQRLGRLNRREPAPASTQRCLLLDVADPRPYQAPDLDQCRTKLRTLLGLSLSQADLAEVMNNIEEGEYAAAAMPLFQDDVLSTPAGLREPSPALTVAMGEDLPDPRRAHRRELVRLSIPMNRPPAGFACESWPRCRGVYVAPPGTIEYSREWGARWAR